MDIKALVPSAVRRHPGAFLTAAGSILLVLRLAGFAGWNEETALAVLTEGGTAPVLVGTGLTFVTIGAQVALAVVSIAVFLTTMTARQRLWTWLTGIPLVAVCAFAPEAGYALAATGMWLLVPVGYHLTPNARANPLVRHVAAAVMALSVAGVVGLGMLGIVIGNPWLPEETVRLADGSVETGFVLKSGTDVVIVRAHDRLVVHRPGPMRARVICRPPGLEQSRSLASLLGFPWPASYPACDPSLV